MSMSLRPFTLASRLLPRLVPKHTESCRVGRMRQHHSVGSHADLRDVVLDDKEVAVEGGVIRQVHIAGATAQRGECGERLGPIVD